MKKILKKLNRAASKNKGLVALLAIGVTALAFVYPQQTAAKIDEAKEATWWDEFAGLFDNGGVNGTNGGVQREVQVKYDQGTLTGLGVLEVDGGSTGDFSVEGTSAAGQPAKFELLCGPKLCGTITDTYQEPLTYWIVSVPEKPGLTKLLVTAGAAYLEVQL